MTTKLFLALFVLTFFVACRPTDSTEAPAADTAESESELVERARGIHDRVLTLDTHVDIPSNYATMKSIQVSAATSKSISRKWKRAV